MSTNAVTLPDGAARLMAAAPHRLLFLVGACNVLAAMTWWAVTLAGARFGWQAPPPPVPAGWMHAVIMQYQVLPSFIFGFLLTVFPRWLGQPPLAARHYLPVGAGLLGGQILTLAGLGGSLALLRAGGVLTFIGWTVGMTLLTRVLLRSRSLSWHALGCLCALAVGLVGLTFYLLLLARIDAAVALAAIKLGGVPMLLPIYFTVCHRMIPFFTNLVVRDYRVVRPMWTLGAFWVLAIAHSALDLRHEFAWTWVVDAPLALLFAGLLRAWWPRGALPPLLRVLYLGFAWLPAAFALYALQSGWLAATGEFLLGRAPAHALFIGFFGSLLVAMVTRVTQGHSGRPLVLGATATIAFVLVQLTALLRIVAEVAADSLMWQAVAAAAWLAAFLPWVARSSWIYLTPRADGQPG